MADAIDDIQKQLEQASQPAAPAGTGATPAGQPAAPPPAVGGTDTGALVAAALAQAQMILGTARDNEDTVVVGWEQVRTSTGPASIAGDAFQTQLEMVPVEKSLEEVAQDIWMMPTDDLHQLQIKLFAAGFYGNLDFDDIAWDKPGPDTYAAFVKLLDHATQAVDPAKGGERVPWWKVLDDLAGTPEEIAGAFGRSMPTTTTTLTDPARLRQTFDAAARAVLGKRLSPKEQQAFVSMLHSMERQQGAAANQAAIANAMGTGSGGNIEVMSPSVEARAIEFARQQDPTLARAHDATAQYDSFLSIIGGRR